MKLYEDKEIEDLEKWFAAADLPKDLQYDKATYFPDLRKSVNALITLLKNQNNVIFSSALDQLKRIKEILESST